MCEEIGRQNEGEKETNNGMTVFMKLAFHDADFISDVLAATVTVLFFILTQWGVCSHFTDEDTDAG